MKTSNSAESHRGTERALGMDRPIHRRDFLNGVAIAIGAAGTSLPGPASAAIGAAWPQDEPGYYPPMLTGLRGSHPGSFETAHQVRDGEFWSSAPGLEPTGEHYDLIVVGGGISGLAAAHFFKAARPQARILILDNHDDFGGHAKRNEFHLDGKLHLMNGGTLEIDSPRPYSAVADGLLKSLGIEPVALAAKCNHQEIYRSLGLGQGVFFDKETFGADRLVAGMPARGEGDAADWASFLAKTPLSPSARADVARIETGRVDYLPGLTEAQKKDRLSRLSYRAFLTDLAKVDVGAAAFYQSYTQGEWGVGIDAVSALDCWGFGAPGFQGLDLKPGSAPRMSFTPAGYAQGGSYVFHFPDGNATIARLLVRSLIPAAVPGRDCHDVVTANVDYGLLDRPGHDVRIRLSGICVRARNLGGPQASRGVEVAYVRGGRLYRVTASSCVLASWNMMIPYLCPELPQTQKAALHKIVKTPLVYSTVALRDWTSFHRLGISSVTAPGGYHTSFRLNMPVDVGGYRSERLPENPILIRMTRTPCRPGLAEFDQNRAGRAELLATPFETFEREIRSQLGRTLAGGGFDPARDITAITVNRWPHGYAPEWNPLWEEPLPVAEQPNVIGRARFGRIAIANSDAGAAAYTDCAIDQAHRAVGELLVL
jgi:spermidine dehydrogenase